MSPKPYSTVAAYIPTDVVVRLDQKAKELQISRSNMVRRILKEYVENLKEPNTSE